MNGNADIWVIDMARNVLRRFTDDPAIESRPSWSPDGARIVFESFRRGVNDIYEKAADGSTPERLLLATSTSSDPWDWSPDGRFILYDQLPGNTNRDLWALPLGGDRKPFPVVQTRFSETNGRFSPNSRWIAYHSNETGRNEVHVQAFPGPGGKSQISTNGGFGAQWGRDGREIFYVAPGNRLMTVSVTFPGNGTSAEVEAPVPLFTLPPRSALSVSPDGQRFLVTMPLEDAPPVVPITVILNWKPPAK